MVITDPPFNVKIEGNVGGLGRVRHPDFAMASGEMSGEQFTSFLSTAFSHDGSAFRRRRLELRIHGLASSPRDP